MSPPAVPSNVAPFIAEAAKGTGLPESVVAAQNYTESDYGNNQGPSSGGAEGPWQFLPGTFTSLGFSLSQITNWSTSTTAYIKFMNQLLQEEGGNVRDALAAYNAGPGNISAGYGYADSILSMAGQSSSISVAAGGGSSASIGSDIGGILSIPSQITGFFGDADTFVTKLMWIVQPSNWLRIGALMLGVMLLIGAIIVFTKADQKISAMPVPVPV